jgi:hypothetical protein
LATKNRTQRSSQKTARERLSKSLEATQKPYFIEHRDELFTSQNQTRFVVFLCGPSIRNRSPGAAFRRQLRNQLGKNGIDVALGEDDGLEEIQKIIQGLNAQDNELQFAKRKCDAIVIIAESPGSFCELGLFSWHYVHQNGELQLKTSGTALKDFILVIDKRFEGKNSYINSGPAKAISAFGVVHYLNLKHKETDQIIDRLLQRRAARITEKRGRPPKPKTEVAV